VEGDRRRSTVHPIGAGTERNLGITVGDTLSGGFSQPDDAVRVEISKIEALENPSCGTG
jgi:hypothetical protein